MQMQYKYFLKNRYDEYLGYIELIEANIRSSDTTSSVFVKLKLFFHQVLVAAPYLNNLRLVFNH